MFLETLKAYLRKKDWSRQLELPQKLKEIDSSYANCPDSLLYKTHLQLQTEFDLLSTSKAALQLKSRQCVFESGDKASELLAQQARTAAASRLITSIKSPLGVVLTFAKFYSDLYTSDCTQASKDNILDTSELPGIDSNLMEDLCRQVTMNEIEEAIKTLQSGKSPGPDGSTVEFYKKSAPLLSPALRDMYNDAVSNGSLPPTMINAMITLLLKKYKDPLLCSSYRPISH